MEINGVTGHRNRQSPSSDRFIGMFTQSNFPVSAVAEDDLNEAEVFWTANDSSPLDRRPASQNEAGKVGFRQPKSFGILTALHDEDGGRVLLQKNRSIVDRENMTTSFSVSPAVLKPLHRQMERELSHSQSLPSRRFQHSAPLNVPAFSKAVIGKNRTFTGFDDRRGGGADEDDVDENDDDQMLPPHEIVAMKVKAASSVLEGVGRTLKGRDLRQVRNAVWRQTGFLD